MEIVAPNLFLCILAAASLNSCVQDAAYGVPDSPSETVPAQYLSDIFYDYGTSSLWITDSKSKALTNIKPDGTIIGTYDISFVTKLEGFCIDAKRKMFWFTCDQTGRLHSINYE